MLAAVQSKVHVSNDGSLSLTISCAKIKANLPAPANCAGKTGLTAELDGATRSLGSSRFVRPQGAEGTVTLQLNDRAMTALRDRSFVARLTAKVGERTPSTRVRLILDPEGKDSDGDRLPDSVETNTGTYVSASDTGTDPNKADTDGDSISDGDEVLGTTAGLDLPALGFSPVHQDLAFEMDWMDDSTGCGPHSHRVHPATIDKVVDAYAKGTHMNPDGTTGVHFIADYGQGGAFTGGNLLTDAAADGHVDGDFAPDYWALKKANFDPNRKGYFHYLISAHDEPSFPGSAGVGQLNGDDMIVTQECYFDGEDQFANIVFHEGGHNLGLQHGGFEGQNFKPNYPSVMNYGMTNDDGLGGPDTDCDGKGNVGLGYSSGLEIDLDENALIEADGVCGPGHPIDWNNNGIIDPDPIAMNLNPQEGLDLSVLKDYDDWANLNFNGIHDSDNPEGVAAQLRGTNPLSLHEAD